MCSEGAHNTVAMSFTFKNRPKVKKTFKGFHRMLPALLVIEKVDPDSLQSNGLIIDYRIHDR